VLELFHEGDFADGGAGGAFFAVEVDFFEGDELAGLAVAAFEDLHTISLVYVVVFGLRGLITVA
jgi:hypothetical protein